MRPRGNTQEDYLLRIIRQAAELLRQLRRRLLGGETNAESIRQDAAAAIDLLLGAQAPVLGMLVDRFGVQWMLNSDPLPGSGRPQG